MDGKFSTIVALLMVASCLFALPSLVSGATVFWDDFSSGSFSNWSGIAVGSGSTQTVTDGIARFTVPTPGADPCTFSFIKKDGFTSTVNSTLIASQDIYVTKVPNGSPRGNGAIFFLYLCDSTDLSGKRGNFGVGIDGSQVWSLWIGSNIVYTYVFQTAGSTPVSNTWYRVVLTVDNPSGTASLSVNGLVVINVDQHEFTDGTHPITLMTGMGEDWWSAGSGLQEIDIDNVSLSISDMTAPSPTPPPSTQTPTPTPLPTPNSNPEPSPTQTANMQTPTPNPTTKPPASPSPFAMPTQMPSPVVTPTQAGIRETPPVAPLWMALFLTLALAVGVAVAFTMKKR